MGCDSPEVNVGKIYGRPMPKESEKDVTIDTVTSCTVKGKGRLLDRVFDLHIGKRRLIIDAPRDPDAAFLANALTGAKVRYSLVTRARGCDGEYTIDDHHRFEILDGPLAGNVHELNWWEIKPSDLSKPLPDAQRRYAVGVLEGKVLSCAVEGTTLHARIGKHDVDIPTPKRNWRTDCSLPELPLLAYAMLGNRVRYETYKLRDPAEVIRHQLYREKMMPEQHHRLSLLSGDLKGYEFGWAL